MDLFQFITQGCQSLAATAAPSITTLGIHMVLALATIMMVWFGVQEALASSQGGPGFNMAKFFSFFMLITFAYCFVNFYDTSIPGLGFSIRGFIDGGTANLVQTMGQDSFLTMLDQLDSVASKIGTGMPSSLFSLYAALVYLVVQILLSVLAAIISAVVAYGVIAATIIGLLGPVFIPFLVFDQLDWLFWGWLKAYLGFSFYKVIAAATFSVMSHVLAGLLLQLINVADPGMMVKTLPLLILLVVVNGFILFKIPAMTHTLFSGGTGGHGVSLGGAMMAIRALMG